MATTLTNYDISKHPAADSANNNNYRDVVGNKTDTIAGNSLVSMLKIVESRLNNPSKVYPTLANGTIVTAGVGAWALGNAIEVIPAATITNDFLIYFVKGEDCSHKDVFEVILYSGPAAGTEICRCRTTKDPTYPEAGDVAVSTEIIPANTKISAKAASQNGGSHTVTISLHYVEIA